ncbi:hypothetical protein FM125_11125 [Micrococcus lylae]|uniref:Mutator family transposase n=1 Tax=Micrococcus lylae TaxID=1273 RepID=A0A1R4JWX8_9MICC|nr:hypothetical protein FM125_11125 [Micrococcus lylae]
MMTAPHIVDPAGLLGEALSEASPDMMGPLLQTMINTLLCADADAVVGAEWGKPSCDRTAQRNGYRHRDLDTRVGTVDVAIPKLRSGTYFPSVAAGAPQAGGIGADHCRRELLPGRGVHPADGQAGQDLGHPHPVEVPGVPDGRGPQ